MGRVQERSIKEKAKARKSGPSVLQKTKDLGVLANVFAATIHWDPTHRCHRVAVHLPEGETVPDVNSLIADALAESATQQPQRQSRRLLQSAQSSHRKEQQLASRRNARRRRRCSSQSPFSTPADPYVFPDTSADEAESDSRSRAGGSARHKCGVSGSVGAAEGEEPRDLQHAPGHSTDRALAPVLTSAEPSDPCQGHDSIAMNKKQPENSMSWIGDASWENVDVSLLDNIFTDDHTAGRLSATEELRNTQAESSGLHEKKTAPARPVPGLKFRRLARDSLMLLTDILSSQAKTAPLSGCAPERTRNRYIDRRTKY